MRDLVCIVCDDGYTVCCTVKTILTYILHRSDHEPNESTNNTQTNVWRVFRFHHCRQNANENLLSTDCMTRR